MDGDLVVVEAELANRGDNGRRAAAKDLRDAPGLHVVEHLVNVHHLLCHLIPQMAAQLDDRLARHAGQDAAGQRRGDDTLPVIDEADVHGPHFLDVAAFDGVEPEHLRVPLLARVLAGVEAGGVVAARFGLAHAAVYRPHVLVGNVYGDGVEALLEVGADGADDDVVEVAGAGMDAQRCVRGDHRRPDVERGIPLARNPFVLHLDQPADSRQVFLLVHRRHSHTPRGIVEPPGVLHRPEEVDVAIRPPVGLHALEDKLGVVEHGRGRVHGERCVRLNARVVPPLAARVALGEHPVGKVDAKAVVVAERRPQPRGINGHDLDIHDADSYLLSIRCW